MLSLSIHVSCPKCGTSRCYPLRGKCTYCEWVGQGRKVDPHYAKVNEKEANDEW